MGFFIQNQVALSLHLTLQNNALGTKDFLYSPI